MERVGKFEKVSFGQFYADMKSRFYMDEDSIRELYCDIQLPVRATRGSAGYDFRSPMGFVLPQGETITIPTGIRARIEPGWFLACVPRSGLGFKYRLQLDNTIGVIDEDYYLSDNEGHIHIKVTNDSKGRGETLCVNAGDRIVQAIFLPYGVTYEDSVDAIRNGGIGSTG